MENEGDQDNSTNDVPETQQAFRYTDFTFMDVANQGTYTQFQKQATIQKTTYTKFANDSIKEITAQTKATKNAALYKMIEASGDYFIRESKVKLDKATDNYKDFVTFVSKHDFTQEQLQNFITYIDSQSSEKTYGFYGRNIQNI